MSLLEQIKPEIDKHRVISFDIFDTLLLRPYVKPTDLFLHLERLENAKGFAKARIEAEKQARKTHSDLEDINIDEIYDEIADKYKGLKEKEMALEAEVLTANPEMKEVYDYAIRRGKIVIIVSDMYLPRDFLACILQKNGIRHYHKLYVSSEYRHLKYSGNLYEDVLDDLRVTPKNILHIGDNNKTDGEAARKKGFSTYTFEKNIDVYVKNPRINKLIKNFPNNIGVSVIVGLGAIYSLKHGNYWDTFGYNIAGPICLSYVNWIFQRTSQTNIKDIVFIARDGFLLEKIFKLYNTGVKTHYIYAPRSLNLICQLNYVKTGKFAYEQAMTIINFYKSKDERLKSIPNTLDKQAAIDVLEKYKDIFVELAEKERSAYKKYIQKKNLGKNIATVDSVSMFFSAQKFFEKIFLEKNFYGFYYLIQKGADTKNNNVDSFKKISSYSEDLKLVEFIMTSPEPPIEYVSNDKPKYKEISISEQKRIDAYNIFSSSALQFAQDVKKYFNDLNLNMSSSEISEFINTFIDYPTIEDRQAFSDVLFAYDPEHEKYIQIFEKWRQSHKLTYKYTVQFFKMPFLTFKKNKELFEIKFFNIPLITYSSRSFQYA